MAGNVRMKVLWITFVIGLMSLPKECHSWLFSSWSRTCYNTPPIGCFPTTSPFTNTGGIAPQDPAVTPVKFYLHRPGEERQELLLDSLGQRLGESYNLTRKTVVIVHGYMENTRAAWVTTMLRELHAKGDANIISVDWETGANNMNYYQCVANTRVVGAVLALLLQNLVTLGADLSEFHLVGFSLGAHVAGYAGSRVQGVGRITGLDPAGPAFDGTPAEVRLDPTDATLVDVIHTDGVRNVGLGTMQAMGHVDFYPNRGANQPGCPSSMLDRFTAAFVSTILNAVACSHFRVVYLFSASINNACNETSTRYETHRVSWSARNRRADWQPCQDEASCPRMGYNLDPSAVDLYREQIESTSGGNLLVAMQTPGSWPFC